MVGGGIPRSNKNGGIELRSDRNFIMMMADDVYYYIGERPKLKGETENMGVCTKERKGMTAEVLMATPCTKSLGGENGGHK